MDKCASLRSAHRWTERTRPRARAARSRSVCPGVSRCSRLRFITVHTQTVAVFLCQCLMRGWESGDLTAVRSSCSLELPPVPMHSLQALEHTHTHIPDKLQWFSHPGAPLSVLDACKQVIVVGWAGLPDRNYKDHGNINWFISYSSWTRPEMTAGESDPSLAFCCWHRSLMEIWMAHWLAGPVTIHDTHSETKVQQRNRKKRNLVQDAKQKAAGSKYTFQKTNFY